MRILHWNCQGLRNPLTIPFLKDINCKYKIDILFLVETKNKDAYVQRLCTDLHFHHHFLISPDGLSGGLVIFWRDTIKCEFLSSPTLYYTNMYITDDHSYFCLTYIYGHPERTPRQQLWNKLELLARGGLFQNKPRVILGDFNEIKQNSEKLGGPMRPEWQFTNFPRMIKVAGLHEVKTFGGPYTWVGNRSSGPVKSKLDRVLATATWKEQYPKAFAHLLEWVGSDHRPLLLQTEDNKWRGKKLFRYDNRWRFQKDVHLAIQNTWAQNCCQLPPHQFHEALKRCKNSLSTWKSEHHLNSQKKIHQLQTSLHQAYDSLPIDYNYISSLKAKLQNEYRLEEEF
ncbi:Endonuclease/exonuclease/phosphatase [Arabidopsis thaliana x Arabidopsis arenosa]|uniref:Endonuclease/exonuclease/phosphatase n=1 Tax=Arabidopsis thaliana x Arabidopsis arenosa TaxID=1240361 RepID=A0A8T2FM76_9BRAS|nr:Endonuclease/exonuclease/phosphatase [Arabidopsis thaliana x Arabidopsis arenosa]